MKTETDLFLESFTDNDLKAVWGKLILATFPDDPYFKDVDTQDPRVIELIAKCRLYHENPHD